MKLRCSLTLPSCKRCLDRGIACAYEPDIRSAQLSNSRIGNGTTVNVERSTETSLIGSSSESPGVQNREDSTSLLDQDTLWPLIESSNDHLDAIHLPYGIDPDLEPLKALTNVPPAFQALSHSENSSMSNSSSVLTHQSTFQNSSDRDYDVQNVLPTNYQNIVTYGMGISHLPPNPTVQNLIEYTRNYPRQMLDVEYWPPFVHSRRYRCSSGGVAEPLAVALCCVSAKFSGFRSAAGFLCNLVESEKVRLAEGFVSLALQARK